MSDQARLASAVQFVQTAWDQAPFDEERYRQELEYLVNHRDQLTHRVYVQLPGGLSGNADSKWDHIKANSEERCGCGNERVILPGNPRTEYEASEAGTVVVSADSPVYLKPIGGDKASAFVKLEIQEGAMTFLQNPFAPLVLTPDIFTTRGYKLDELADVLPKQSKPPVFILGKEKVPVFGINAVDVEAGTVTITPDLAVEVFDPDAMPDHAHSECGQPA